LEPLKVRIRTGALPESSEDETETAATGTTTPDTHMGATPAEPESPVFVKQDVLSAVPASPTLKAEKGMDASMPAFIPVDRSWVDGAALHGNGGASPQPWQPVATTLSLQNVPAQYTPEMLLAEIRDGGFRLHRDFDFFHVLQDCEPGTSLRRCIVSFPEEGVAKAFEAAFHDRAPRLAWQVPEFQVCPAACGDLEAALFQSAACQAEGVHTASGAAWGCPQQARFCPQCGSEADCFRFNFCWRCGESLVPLRKQPLWA